MDDLRIKLMEELLAALGESGVESVKSRKKPPVMEAEEMVAEVLPEGEEEGMPPELEEEEADEEVEEEF